MKTMQNTTFNKCALAFVFAKNVATPWTRTCQSIAFPKQIAHLEAQKLLPMQKKTDTVQNASDNTNARYRNDNRTKHAVQLELRFFSF